MARHQSKLTKAYTDRMTGAQYQDYCNKRRATLLKQVNERVTDTSELDLEPGYESVCLSRYEHPHGIRYYHYVYSSDIADELKELTADGMYSFPLSLSHWWRYQHKKPML